MSLFSQDNPDGMDNAGYISTQREKNIQPEMQANADLQKYTDGRQDNGEKNANNVHD